jgi:hypothetical protein
VLERASVGEGIRVEPQTLYLTSLFAGIPCLIGAVGVARWNWRKDISPFGRQSRVLDILLHSERYAETRVVSLIRILGFVGGAFLLVAAAALAYELSIEVR